MYRTVFDINDHNHTKYYHDIILYFNHQQYAYRVYRLTDCNETSWNYFKNNHWCECFVYIYDCIHAP